MDYEAFNRRTTAARHLFHQLPFEVAESIGLYLPSVEVDNLAELRLLLNCYPVYYIHLSITSSPSWNTEELTTLLRGFGKFRLDVEVDAAQDRIEHCLQMVGVLSSTPAVDTLSLAPPYMSATAVKGLVEALVGQKIEPMC